MAKSDREGPAFVIDVAYIPAACIGRNARGPVAHHQIRGNLDGGTFEEDQNEHYFNIVKYQEHLLKIPDHQG